MKTIAFALIALSASAAAHADGFVCQTVAGDLNIKAYNNTDATSGTRNAAVMVLSDPSVSGGHGSSADGCGDAIMGPTLVTRRVEADPASWH